jgi:hypothetical protein
LGFEVDIAEQIQGGCKEFAVNVMTQAETRLSDITCREGERDKKIIITMKVFVSEPNLAGVQPLHKE